MSGEIPCRLGPEAPERGNLGGIPRLGKKALDVVRYHTHSQTVTRWIWEPILRCYVQSWLSTQCEFCDIIVLSMGASRALKRPLAELQTLFIHDLGWRRSVFMADDNCRQSVMSSSRCVN